MNANTVTIGEVRLSYVNLFEPRAPQGGGEPKYSVTILLPKGNTAAMEAINGAVEAAKQAGIAKKWGGRLPAKIASSIHDGDGLRDNGEPFGEECRGHWVFTASCKAKPPVVDRNVQPIIDTDDVYSGCYANVNISFFPYDAAGKRGIGCGLNCVQKVRDGEPLGGQVSVSEAFQPVADAAPAVPGTDMVYDPLTGGFRKA